MVTREELLAGSPWDRVSFMTSVPEAAAAAHANTAVKRKDTLCVAVSLSCQPTACAP